MCGDRVCVSRVLSGREPVLGDCISLKSLPSVGEEAKHSEYFGKKLWQFQGPISKGN